MNPITFLRRLQSTSTVRTGRGDSIRYGFGGSDDPKLGPNGFEAPPMSARAACMVFDLRRIL